MTGCMPCTWESREDEEDLQE